MSKPDNNLEPEQVLLSEVDKTIIFIAHYFGWKYCKHPNLYSIRHKDTNEIFIVQNYMDIAAWSKIELYNRGLHFFDMSLNDYEMRHCFWEKSPTDPTTKLGHFYDPKMPLYESYAVILSCDEAIRRWRV